MKNTLLSHFKQVSGIVFVVTLFIIAEFSTEISAQSKKPLQGTWQGTTDESPYKYSLVMEDDGSFTWLSGSRRVLTGEYEIKSSDLLRLKFGPSKAEMMDYYYKSPSPTELVLRQGKIEYRFIRHR